MSWVDCVVDNDYQIFTEEPYQIRRKSNKRIVKEGIHKSSGYIRCKLNQIQYYKHQILARQFIENPDNLPEIDHINRIRTDNRLENLRWVSHSENQKNKTSCGEYKYNYVDELSNDSFEIAFYGKHQLQNYYYEPINDKFYRFDDNQYKELKINQHSTGLLINMIDEDGEHFGFRVRKFKRLYNI